MHSRSPAGSRIGSGAGPHSVTVAAGSEAGPVEELAVKAEALLVAVALVAVVHLPCTPARGAAYREAQVLAVVRALVVIASRSASRTASATIVANGAIGRVMQDAPDPGPS